MGLASRWSELIITGSFIDITNFSCILILYDLARKNLLQFLKSILDISFSALLGRQEGHPTCKKTEWLGAGMAICLE